MFNSVEDMIVAPSITKAEYKVPSEDEETAEFIAQYKKDLESSIIRWWLEADHLNRQVFQEYQDGLTELGDVGNLVLDIPYGLANYLRIEYGGGSLGIFDDRDFLRYLQEAVGQTFLSKI